MLKEINRFLQRSGLPPTLFGRLAVNDPRLVSDLLKGRELRPKTAAKIKAFMAKYEGI